MISLPRNVVNLGNEIFAQVQLSTLLEEYHVKNTILDVKINDNIITWFIPKFVFGYKNHVKFILNIYCHSDSKCLVELRKSTQDSDDPVFRLAVRNGLNELSSWGNKGGDLCIIKPNTVVEELLTKQFNEHLMKLHLTTFRKKIPKGLPVVCKTETDGFSADSIPIHFATVGKSTQTFKVINFDEDKSTAVFTEFKFECV